MITFSKHYSHLSKGNTNFLVVEDSSSSVALLPTIDGVHQIIDYLWAKFPSVDLGIYHCQTLFIDLMDFVKSSFDYVLLYPSANMDIVCYPY